MQKWNGDVSGCGTGNIANYYHICMCVFVYVLHITQFDNKFIGYGDSSEGELNEDNIVLDSVEIFKWVRNSTNSDVFVWGHSLGTGIGVITIAKLGSYAIHVKGLILETPFTSSRDVILNSKISQVIILYYV